MLLHSESLRSASEAQSSFVMWSPDAAIKSHALTINFIIGEDFSAVSHCPDKDR
jgi:hypothetical protein